MGDGEVHLDVARADGKGADESAGDDGAGKAGLSPVEIELVAGLSVCEGDGMGEPCAPLEKTFMPCGTRKWTSAVKRSVM